MFEEKRTTILFYYNTYWNNINIICVYFIIFEEKQGAEYKNSINWRHCRKIYVLIFVFNDIMKGMGKYLSIFNERMCIL